MLAEEAERLRALHAEPGVLVLPNAWDAASAKAFQEAGFAAIATTSAGVVESLGHRDGERAPVDEVLAAVARICGAVSIPVTADLEGGYGLDADAQAAKLAAVKDAARGRGVDVVLNARVDVHVRQFGPEEERLPEALRRARLYREAGADCLYPITVADEPTIGALVEQSGLPVNILMRAGVPPVSRLAELGVARVTFGSGLMRTAVAAAVAAAEEARAG